MKDDRRPVATMPIGHNRGVPLTEIPDRELRATREWCREREDEGHDWSKLINAIDEVLEDRQGLSLGLDDPHHTHRKG